MKKILKENVECLLKDTYRRRQDDDCYCLLYYPSRTRESYCPYLERESLQVTLGEGLFSTKLDYWRCHRERVSFKADYGLITQFKRLMSDD